MKKVLGKGLTALIPDGFAEDSSPVIKKQSETTPGEKLSFQRKRKPQAFEMIAIDAILPNKDQPRKEFSPSEIEDLAASIKEKGILQPIVVKWLESDQYMLICGERRLRAARLCGLSEVPAVVNDIAADDFLEWALVENIQRQDLNPLEEAGAYAKLVEERMLSQEEVAKRVGKNRSTVANMIRLLRLPEEVRQLIVDGLLSSGHARALLGLLTPEHQRQLARRIAEEKLSVRQVEAIVNRSQAHKRKAKQARHLKPEILDLERRLAEHFGTQVRLYPRKNQTEGRIEIQYYSLDDLDRILGKAGIVVS